MPLTRRKTIPALLAGNRTKDSKAEAEIPRRLRLVGMAYLRRAECGKGVANRDTGKGTATSAERRKGIGPG